MSVIDEIKSAEAKAAEIRHNAVLQAREDLREANARARDDLEKAVEAARASQNESVEKTRDLVRLEAAQVADMRTRKFEAEAEKARSRLPQAAADIVGRIVK